jgi:hypothetical protein
MAKVAHPIHESQVKLIKKALTLAHDHFRGLALSQEKDGASDAKPAMPTYTVIADALRAITDVESSTFPR